MIFKIIYLLIFLGIAIPLILKAYYEDKLIKALIDYLETLDKNELERIREDLNK